jgi:hypothetical protein
MFGPIGSLWPCLGGIKARFAPSSTMVFDSNPFEPVTLFSTAKNRVTRKMHGKVRYQLKTPYRDGTTGDRRSHAIFEPLDFIACLADLVPKPRVNLTRFHGVFVRGGPRGAALHQTVGTA